MSGKKALPFLGLAIIGMVYFLISGIGLGQEQKENRFLIGDIKEQGIKASEIDIKGTISEFIPFGTDEIQINIKPGGVLNIKGESSSISK